MDKLNQKDLEKESRKIRKVHTWNYRVLRKNDPKYGDERWFEIHEVYYDNKGVPCFWSVNPMQPFGDTVKALKTDLRGMAEAFKKPVLEEVMFRGKQKLVEWESDKK